MCCSSNSSDSSADTGPLTTASNAAAANATALSQAQLAEAQRQYDNNTAVAAPVVAAQTAILNSQKAQGDAYYADYIDTYKPIAQGLVNDANNFSTASAQERFAQSAASDLQGQQANQEAQNNRAMTAMGVNPNSGKYAALSGQQRVLNAAARAGATSNARVQADALGTSKRIAAYGLGSNLPTLANNTYAGATNAGTAAVASNAQAGNALNTATTAANATALAGTGQQISGLTSGLNASTSANNAALQANATTNAGYGSAIGAGLGLAATLYKPSK